MNDELDVLRELRAPATSPDPAIVARARTALMSRIAEAEAATAPAAADDARVATSSAACVTGPEAASITTPALAGPTRRSGVADPNGDGGETPARVPTPSARRRRVWRIGAGIGLVGAAAAASWVTVARHDPSLTTHIECTGVGLTEVRSGSPVADCAAAWRAARGTEPPPLVAYTDEAGANVYVLDAGQDPPRGLVPLREDDRQDTRIRELNDELADVDRGLGARCRTAEEAVGLVTGQLVRLGLDEWTVHIDPPATGQPRVPHEPCLTWLNYLDSQERPRAVVIRPMANGRPQGLERERELASTLYERLVTGPQHRCMTLDEAVGFVREEAERLGFDLDSPGIQIDALPAPPGDEGGDGHSAGATGVTCARPTTWVGGVVHVTLREAALPQASPSMPDSEAGPACPSTTVAHAARLPDDFAPPVRGRGGVGDHEEPDPCITSATSRDNPGRHVTFAEGTSPYGLPQPHVLPNGARRAYVEDGYVAELDVDGGVVHVLGYGLTLAEFDALAGAL